MKQFLIKHIPLVIVFAVLFVAVSAIVLPQMSFAQNTATQAQDGTQGFVFCGNTADEPCNVTHLFRTMIIIINYLITMVGFVAVLFIVIAGVQMVISQGQEQLKAAKQRLSGAIIGMVLVALSFVLINSLLAGSLNIGIRQGGLILTNPKEYINQ